MSWKLNPFTGKLDYFEEQSTVANVERLIDQKECGQNISALKMVRAINESEVIIAQPDNFINSKSLGLALQSGLTGQNIEILLFGKIEDSVFNFSINQPLFLGVNGSITDIAPQISAQNFSANIGYSLGSGAIFINIQEPIEI